MLIAVNVKIEREAISVAGLLAHRFKFFRALCGHHHDGLN